MNRLSYLLCACLFAFALPFAAVAADSAGGKTKNAVAAPLADYSPVLKIFKAQGVTANYLGRQYGLDGWLLTKGGQIQVMYVTPDGQGAVLGTMYGPDGNLVTGEQLETAKKNNLLPKTVTAADQDASPTAPAPAASVPAAAAADTAPTTPAVSKPPGAIEAARAGEVPSERLWKQVVASTSIKFGSDDAPPFYVIMDPRCEYCQKLFNTLNQKLLPANALQLRVIPVGILDQAGHSDSHDEAAKAISVPEESATHWAEIERHNISNLPPIADGANDKIAQNHQIMTDWDLKGTPSCIYRGKDGKVKIVLGIPHDMDAVAADIGPGTAPQ